MREFYRAILLFVFFLSVSTFAYANCTASFNPHTLNQAQIVHYPHFDVVNLHGDYCSMGREYGHLEGRKLRQFYQAFYQYKIEKQHNDYQLLLSWSQKLFNDYPKQFQNYLIGMSQTSGLSLNQEIFLNAFEDIFSFNTASQPKKQFGCALLATWGAFTSHKQLVIGRNYDYFKGLPQFRRQLVITVFHPNNTETAAAMITYNGTLNATTDMNNHHLFLELNNGFPSADLLSNYDYFHKMHVYPTAKLLGMMLRSNSLTQLDKKLFLYHSPGGFIINVSNGQRAHSFEMTRRKVLMAHPVNTQLGELASTNHFVDHRWGILHQPDMWFSKERRYNLLQLASVHKGKINAELMEKLLDKKLGDQKGATRADTVYQIIIIPAKELIYAKLPGLQNDWTSVDLAPYFEH